jgi:superfamily II DNA or RNA helicase
VPSQKQLAHKLVTAFLGAPLDARRLVQLLSIVYAPVSKSLLLNTARQSGTLSGGRSYTTVTLAETLELLSRLKLVHITKEGVRCDTQIMHYATLTSIGDGVFDAMACAVETAIPMLTDWGAIYYRTSLHALRDIRIAFYRGDVPAAFATLARYERQFPYETLRCHPFVAVTGFPFDPDWFRTLPEPLLMPALKEILSHAGTTLSSIPGPFDTLCDLAARDALPEPLIDIYCKELLLRDRTADAERAARDGMTSTQLAVLACCALRRGSCQGVIDLFEAALSRLKKETGKRKTFFDDVTGPFFILALLASGTPEHLDSASTHCTFVTAKKDWPHQQIYSVLLLVARERSGEGGIARRLEHYLVRGDYTPIDALFLTLALHWCDVANLRAMAQELPRLAKLTRSAGYDWIAEELELTAVASGCAVPDAPQLLEKYRRAGLIPLHRLVEKIAPWQSALDALIRLKSGAVAVTAEKAAPQARLIWHVSEIGRYLEIQPREQKVTSTGKWTSGRNVALKKLAEETERIDYLSGQDRLICGCIREERDSYGYYSSRFVYRLDVDKALPLLVGHQHLYLDPAASVRLELLQGEPELRLASEGGSLRIEIHPPFEQDQKICVVKESPTRWKVFEARDDYKAVAAIVGEGLVLPAEAEQKALEAIQSVSSILTVHSDIGTGSADLVPGDDTPCFHLIPYNAGVKLDLLVRPFSDAGPYFRPGTGGETVMAEVEGKRVQAKRDLRKEVRRAADAVAAVPVIAEREEADDEWTFPDPQDALELILQLQSLGDSVRVAWPDGAKFRVRQEATSRHCRVSIRQSKDYFELEGELKVNQELALDLQQLVTLMKESPGRFIALGDGDFLALSTELRKRLDDLASYGDPHGKGFRFHPLAAGVFEEFAAEAGEFAADQHWQNQLKRLREAQSFRPQLPPTLQAELRGYQEEGFYWLNRLAHWGVGACLADDMGLGKTVQALAQILSMAAQGPSLVVAPTSVCLNWESETAKFAPTLNVVMFGNSRREECLKSLKPLDLVICSYGLLQQESELLAQVKWQTIVLDEAQAIKNMATKRSQAAMALTGAFKMVATGTPIENHLGELWNVFRFINPGLLGSLKQFNVKFAIPIEKGQEKKARGRLKKLIQPFILRRTKNQVLEELPSRTEITVKVEMGEEEASFYEALRRSAVEALAGIGKVEGKGDQHLKILAEIMRLRRGCCNPRLILPETNIPSAKLDAFAEIIEELRENRHKALVFSQFVGHLELVREYVEKAGIPYQYLDGSTPPKERKVRMDAFQSGSGDLFLISLKAGGVGLNLTAADYVIHLDPWWNPAVEDQASDRAHRIGQQRPVTIYRLVVKGTIEEKIVGLHQHKRGLADSLLEESDISGKISADELLALLRVSPSKQWD